MCRAGQAGKTDYGDPDSAIVLLARRNYEQPTYLPFQTSRERMNERPRISETGESCERNFSGTGKKRGFREEKFKAWKSTLVKINWVHDAEWNFLEKIRSHPPSSTRMNHLRNLWKSTRVIPRPRRSVAVSNYVHLFTVVRCPPTCRNTKNMRARGWVADYGE